MRLSTRFADNATSREIFLLRTNQGVELIDISILVRVEAISNYCKLFFSNGKTLVVARVLASLEEQLLPRGFLRVHRSHLVNMQFIVRLNNHKKMEAVLQNSFVVPVSRRKKKKCRLAIARFYDARVSFLAA